MRLSDIKARAKKLNEAPIGDYDTYGFGDEENNAFTDKEEKLISSPAHIQKIKDVFSRVPYDINMYFVNTRINNLGRKNKNYHSDRDASIELENLIDYSNIYNIRNIPSHLKKYININKIKQNSITLLYNSNISTRNYMPMTPWILAHRFGHIVDDAIHTEEVKSFHDHK